MVEVVAMRLILAASSALWLGRLQGRRSGIAPDRRPMAGSNGGIAVPIPEYVAAEKMRVYDSTLS